MTTSIRNEIKFSHIATGREFTFNGERFIKSDSNGATLKSDGHRFGFNPVQLVELEFTQEQQATVTEQLGHGEGGTVIGIELGFNQPEVCCIIDAVTELNEEKEAAEYSRECCTRLSLAPQRR